MKSAGLVRDSDEESAYESMGLTDQQRQILDALRDETAISTMHAKELLGVQDRRALNVLNDLCKLNLIRRVGSGRGTRYVLVQEGA